MKSPLSYQISEYDCGPVTILNALNYLFDRDKILPDLIKNIYKYTLDKHNKKGIQGMYGTSNCSIVFLCQYLNHYSEQVNFNLKCELLSCEEVYINSNEKIKHCLNNNGVVVFKCISGVPHFSLLTDIKDDDCYIFDPYFRKRDFKLDGVSMYNDPFKANRIVKKYVLDNEGVSDYNLGKVKDRIALLMYNTSCPKKKDRR
ncbi:MAG: hypothetical protein GX675_00890 [Erysipelotrichaceae bacterium]|nr:hypothetical protein [Erysipelotrichaceae bacterium]